MEEIVISMLFLYPGALVDVISKNLYKYSYCEDETSEAAHIARYFMTSVLITIASILLYARIRGRSVATLTDIVAALTGIGELMWYTVISLVCTIATAVVFRLVAILANRLISWINRKWEGTSIRDAVDAWHEIIYGEDMKSFRDQTIMRIRMGGEEEAGFVKYWPESLSEGIILTQQVLVKAFFDYDENEEDCNKKFIGDPWVALIDSEHGAIIEIYDGRTLYEYLRKNKEID